MAVRALIVSLKYSPGLFKEFELIGRQLAKRGIQPWYLLDDRYGDRIENNERCVYWNGGKTLAGTACATIKGWCGSAIKVRNLMREKAFDFVLCYNTHPVNVKVLRWALEARLGSVRTCFLHEPAKPEHKEYGLKLRWTYRMIEKVQRQTVRWASDVVVPSTVARQRFMDAGYCFGGEIHEVRLLLEDIVTQGAPRRYFSMVGRFNATKRLDQFVDLINLAVSKGMKDEFQIVTADSIGHWVDRLSREGKRRTRVVNPMSLSDLEIAQALRESWGVLCLHGNVTQSGVVPMAFMQGTPVIARDEPGLAQHVVDGVNGRLIGGHAGKNEHLEAMAAVRSEFDRLSLGARTSYEQQFDATNWGEWYNWLEKKLVNMAEKIVRE